VTTIGMCSNTVFLFVQLFVTVFVLVVVLMRLVYTFMYLADLHVQRIV